MENISLKKAAMINAVSKYINIVLQLVFSAILARILTPNDYGIVAVITVFTTFFNTFADMGLGTAIIQKKDVTDTDINYIYTFTVYVGIVLAIIFGLISYPISWFYNDSVYISIGFVLSLSLLINTLNTIPNAILMKKKRFVLVAFRTTVIYVVINILTIIMALNGFKYYALAIQAVLIALFTFIWNYCSTRPRFKVVIKKESILKVASYSSYQFGFNIINYFSRNLDNLLTGKVMGSTALGYYNKAYTLMLYPVNNLTGVITPVLHPILSDYQAAKETIYAKYIKVVKLLALLGVFVSTFCFLGAKEVIGIFYGSQWSESITCFKLLSIAICTQMVTSSTGSVFQSLGNTKLLFKAGIITTTITVISIIIGILMGNIETLSLCVGIAYILHFVISFYILIKKAFEFSLKKFYYDIKEEVVILCVLIVTVAVFPFDNVTNIYLSFCIKFIFLGGVYLISLLLTKEYKVLISLIKKKR